MITCAVRGGRGACRPGRPGRRYTSDGRGLMPVGPALPPPRNCPHRNARGGRPIGKVLAWPGEAQLRPDEGCVAGAFVRPAHPVPAALLRSDRVVTRVVAVRRSRDRKSTRLNSSHITISYAVFCLKK